mmetsp:Transcript_77978/g.241718  ORF Transcript_77978/g.241718 Transcript_77978/m.241718 type:complete len:285 (-) Transcript_77978:246-1100(-)
MRAPPSGVASCTHRGQVPRQRLLGLRGPAEHRRVLRAVLLCELVEVASGPAGRQRGNPECPEGHKAHVGEGHSPRREAFPPPLAGLHDGQERRGHKGGERAEDAGSLDVDQDDHLQAQGHDGHEEAEPPQQRLPRPVAAEAEREDAGVGHEAQHRQRHGAHGGPGRGENLAAAARDIHGAEEGHLPQLDGREVRGVEDADARSATEHPACQLQLLPGRRLLYLLLHGTCRTNAWPRSNVHGPLRNASQRCGLACSGGLQNLCGLDSGPLDGGWGIGCRAARPPH